MLRRTITRLAAGLLIWIAGQIAARAQATWERLEGLRFVDGPHADGDSIETEVRGKRVVFRLYFIDCIESNPESRDRRRGQARELGLRDDPEGDGLMIARQAGAFTREQLREPFTVLTKWEQVDPRGENPSIRAFIVNSKGEDLSQLLVENGLAIIRAGRATTNHPDGTSSAGVAERLRAAEIRATKSLRGAWSIRRTQAPPAPPLPNGVLSAFSRDEIASKAGEIVTVEGVISQVGQLPDGRLIFLNFEDTKRGDFVCIVRGVNVPRVQPAVNDLPLTALEGRRVRIRGPVTLYRGSPQIEIGDPDQILLLNAMPGPASSPPAR